MNLRTLKREHPLWTWWDCIVYCWERADFEPFNDIFVGAVIVLMGLVIMAQALHIYGQEDWVCSRAEYRAVWAGGNLTQAVPCTKETNLRTGETRATKWGKE